MDTTDFHHFQGRQAPRPPLAGWGGQPLFESWLKPT